MLSETFKKVGFLSLGLSLAMTSCSDDAEQTKLPEAQPTSNLEVSSEIIQQVEDLGMNANYVRWDDFRARPVFNGDSPDFGRIPGET